MKMTFPNFLVTQEGRAIWVRRMITALGADMGDHVLQQRVLQ